MGSDAARPPDTHTKRGRRLQTHLVETHTPHGRRDSWLTQGEIPGEDSTEEAGNQAKTNAESRQAARSKEEGEEEDGRAEEETPVAKRDTPRLVRGHVTTKNSQATTSTTWRRATASGAQQPAEVRRVLEKTLEFFAGQSTRAAVLTRQLAGQSQSGDPVLKQHLVRERRRQTRMDGSVNGSLLATAQTVSELLELDCPPDHAAIVRTLGFVLSRQDAPGHFGEGCDPDRHAVGECRHALTGFFSPASKDDEFRPMRFPSGIVIDREEDARCAASCYALEVVLRAREDRRPAVQKHIESLLGLQSLWDMSDRRWTSDVRALALTALAAAPFQYRADARERAAPFIESQTDDGLWADADILHVADAVSRFTAPEARRAVRRAWPSLFERQMADGSFDSDPERTFIAARVLAGSVDD